MKKLSSLLIPQLSLEFRNIFINSVSLILRLDFFLKFTELRLEFGNFFKNSVSLVSSLEIFFLIL